MPIVFIAGATGFIGTRVCKKLHSLDYEIVALKRPDSDISHIKPYIHKLITADLLSPSCVNDILSQLKNDHIDYMIALAGVVDYYQSYEEARKANVDTAKSIIQIAGHLQKKAGLKKMIFGGSVTSRGFMKKVDNPSEMIDESKDYLEKGSSVYCDVKREAEALVNDAIRKDNLCAIIIEPGSVIGKGVGNTTTTNIGLIKKIVKGFPVLNGGASYTSLHRVVEGIVLSLEKGKIGETYLLGGENMTMKDFAKFVRSVLRDYSSDIPGPKIPVFTIPGPIAGFLGKMNLVINSQQVVMGNGFHYIDSTKAKQELGYQHSIHDLREAVEEVLNSMFFPTE